MYLIYRWFYCGLPLSTRHPKTIPTRRLNVLNDRTQTSERTTHSTIDWKKEEKPNYNKYFTESLPFAFSDKCEFIIINELVCHRNRLLFQWLHFSFICSCAGAPFVTTSSLIFYACYECDRTKLFCVGCCRVTFYSFIICFCWSEWVCLPVIFCVPLSLCCCSHGICVCPFSLQKYILQKYDCEWSPAYPNMVLSSFVQKGLHLLLL